MRSAKRSENIVLRSMNRSQTSKSERFTKFANEAKGGADPARMIRAFAPAAAIGNSPASKAAPAQGNPDAGAR
jgi:hypothetical protein